MEKISIIIPTLNCEQTIVDLLNALKKQTVAPDEIIVIDSDSTDKTVELAKNNGAKVISIKQSEFNHGGSRNFAAKNAKGKYIVYMTQDAFPYDDYTIEKLLSSFDLDDDIVASYARQIAYHNSNEREKLIRLFNYPPFSLTKSSTSIESLGIKTYFFSDVCAMYEKEYFFKLNGFESQLNTNEDMLMAARIIADGKKIRYEAEAKVFHSHNSTLKEIYKRNFAIGQFLAKYKNEFQNSNANSEGVKMLKSISKQLLNKGEIGESLLFWIECFVKLVANKLGKL